ncbi:putative membrane protein [Raineyella antarctica]|uniref:Putative membrane protein n=1 Tax=Raineyella antarctica TaxID=1577474 RepID=A0A1G6HED2_9ACTN|nr:YhgE/Pip domain-containing protein [Raineyella antarctica]SDB92285.1 putative membrane protein [Raineyella antarctica]
MSPTDTTRPREAGRNRRWAVLATLVLVPLLLVGTLGWATAGAESRRPSVRAAIVNHDQPVTLQGQMVPLGRQLSAALVEGPTDGTSYTWVLSDDSDAADGLASGRYVARVVIPENFSHAATSYGGDALAAEHATIDITTSRTTGVTDAEVARQLAAAAARSLNTTLTEGYLDQVYLGFNKSAEGMRKLADGTGQLADGAAQLSSGAGQARDGSVQLADGLGLLATNGKPLVDGAGGLESGARQLADGLGQLQAGTKDLPAQTAQLASGSRQVADGAAALSAGLDQLSAGAGQLSGGAATYSSGVKQYTDGVTAAAGGAAQLSAGIDQLTQGLDAALPSQAQLQQLQQVVDQLRPVLEQVSAALKDMQGTADRLAAGTGAVVTGLDRTVTDLKALQTGTPTCPAEIQAQGEAACTAWQQGVSSGASRALALLTTKDQSTGYSIVTAAHAADQGASGLRALVTANGGSLPGLDPAQVQQITTALNDLPGTVSQLQDGVHQLNDGASQLSAGLDRLSANGPALVSGADQLATGAAGIASGAQQSASGASQLASGAGKVATGNEQLAAGMVPLADGIARSADGARKYADGVGTFRTGLAQYVDGVGQSATGARTLSDGLGGLATGASQLATGTDQLHTQVKDGVGSIPTYNDAERKNLASVVAAPIATDNLSANPTPRLAAGALMAAIALWLGALVTYVVLRPLSDRLLSSSRSTGAVLLRTLGPGIGVVLVQAVGVAAVAGPVMGLGTGRAFAVLGVLLLGGAMFALVNHALAAWLGHFGRLIALVMAALAIAGALTSAVPRLYDVLRPLLAPVPVLEAVRAVATGGSVGGPLLGILAWAVLAAGASALAVARRRGLTVAQFVRAYA